MQTHSLFDNVPSIEVRLKICKEGLFSLIDSLQPYAPLDEIDINSITPMIDLVKSYILLFDPVVNYNGVDPTIRSEMVFLENSCSSASTIHESLVRAIGQLRTARRALKTIEESILRTDGFNTKLQNDCFACYELCRQDLIIAHNNINL